MILATVAGLFFGSVRVPELVAATVGTEFIYIVAGLGIGR